MILEAALDYWVMSVLERAKVSEAVTSRTALFLLQIKLPNRWERDRKILMMLHD